MSAFHSAGRGRGGGPSAKRQSLGGEQNAGPGTSSPGLQGGARAHPPHHRWDNPPHVNGPRLSGSSTQAKEQAQAGSESNGTSEAASLHPKSGPSNGGDLMRARMLLLSMALVGCQVTVRTATSRYIGILAAATTDGGDLGLSLSYAYSLKETGTPEGPLQSLIIAGKDVQELTASDIKLSASRREDKQSRSDFQTDVEISANRAADGGSGRSLQRWEDDGLTTQLGQAPDHSLSSGGKWDQFATNEAKFGVKSDYDEEAYTTKLDKSGADFAARERKAARLAAEILGTATTDAHLAEERGQIDDSGHDEEDKYGAVQRSANAYIPPARRLPSQTPSSRANLAAVSQAALARSGENGQNAQAASAAPKKEKSLVYEEFNKFVQKEHVKAAAWQNQQAKREKEARLADLKSWGSSFKLKSPAPADIPSIAQQKRPSQSNPTKSTLGQGDTLSRLPRIEETPPQKVADDAKLSLANMTIPKIPPFNPDKARGAATSDALGAASQAASEKSGATAPASSTSTLKLSAKASTFTPFNPGAAVFKPGGAPQGAAAAPLQSQASAHVPASVPAPAPPAQSVASFNEPAASSSKPLNPFFGSREPQRPVGGAPVNVFSEFSPVRAPRKSDPSMTGPHWPFNGRPFRQIFAPSGGAPPGPFVSPSLAPAEVAGGKSPVPAPAQIPGAPLQGPPFMMPGSAGGPPTPYGFAYPPMAPPYRFAPQGPGGPAPPFPSGMPPLSMAGPYFGQPPFSPPMPGHGPTGYGAHMGNAQPVGSPMFVVGAMPPGGPGSAPPPRAGNGPHPKGGQGGMPTLGPHAGMPGQSPRPRHTNVEEAA